jgi:hypothetical protein
MALIKVCNGGATRRGCAERARSAPEPARRRAELRAVGTAGGALVERFDIIPTLASLVLV